MSIELKKIEEKYGAEHRLSGDFELRIKDNGFEIIENGNDHSIVVNPSYNITQRSPRWEVQSHNYEDVGKFDSLVDLINEVCKNE